MTLKRLRSCAGFIINTNIFYFMIRVYRRGSGEAWNWFARWKSLWQPEKLASRAKAFCSEEKLKSRWERKKLGSFWLLQSILTEWWATQTGHSRFVPKALEKKRRICWNSFLSRVAHGKRIGCRSSSAICHCRCELNYLYYFICRIIRWNCNFLS